MATYVAFTPAINDGGRSATMADLRTELPHMGLVEVESYIRKGPLRRAGRSCQPRVRPRAGV